MMRRRKGITLVELMTAAFVLTVGLLGALGLATSNARNQSIGAARLAAANLAREGVELARNIRDSNWLAGDAWYTGLSDRECAVPDVQGGKFSFRDCGNLTSSAYAVFRTPDGVHYQGVSSRPGEEEVYRTYRRVKFAFLCLDGDTETTNCDPTNAIGVKVSSEVSQLVRGQDRVTEITAKLYDWKQ